MARRMALAAVLLAACDGPAHCTQADLQAALDAARPGDEVRVGSCRIEGGVRVPAGVTLRGVGADSVIAPAEGTGVFLEPGEPAARVADLVVEAGALAGIGSAGGGACATPRAGSVAIERVEVRATRGWGIYLSCLEGAQLTEVAVRGPVGTTNFMSTAFANVLGEPPAAGATCSSMPSGSCAPGETRETTPLDCPGCGALLQVCDACERWATLTAIEGLALRNVADAVLTGVDVSGFARIGVTVVGSTVRWTAGSIEEQIGVGAWVGGSDVDMSAISVSRTLESPWRVDPGVGLYAGGASSLSTTDLVLEANTRYGILQVGSTASHVGLVARDNGDAALWVGGSDSFELRDAELAGNAFAGVVLSSCENVVIRDTVVSGTQIRRSNVASGTETGQVDAGDGLHLVATTANVEIASTLLDGNARAGIALDLGLGGGVRFSEVTVRGTGEQLGAVAGNASGTRLTPVSPGDGGWDDGITREGATALNDSALVGSIDIAAVTAPTELPAPEGARGVTAPTE